MGERPLVITVPHDLAVLLVEDGMAVIRPPDMSALPGLIDAFTVGSTAIQLLQGPATVAQYVRLLRRWKQQRETDGSPIEGLEMRHPSGVIVKIDNLDEAGLAELGQALEDLVKAVSRDRAVRTTTAFDDDDD